MEAIILAGGFGTRLKHVVSDVPKPMAPINNKPFLEYIFEDLNKKGVTNVVLAVGYMKEKIEEYFKYQYKNIEISYSEENSPLGTGGAIKKAVLKCREENIFIINGDTFYDVNLEKMRKFHIENKSSLTIAVKEMENFDRYGSLIIENNKIIKFEEKKPMSKGKINGGIYLIKKNIFQGIEEESFSFEKEILENEKTEKYAYESNGYFIDIGIPEDYYKFIEKNKSPKISIIVPVYNREKYLEKCINSIIKQDFKDIEIICVNDGSTDNSLEILKKLSRQDERIIVIDKKNGGSSSARNAALKIARGKYCLNIDSDDWIEQGYFKALYERAEKDDLDITISDIKKQNEKTGLVEIIKDLNIGSKNINSINYLKSFYTNNFLGYTWNKLIKRELYTKNKIFYNENIFLLEDVELIGKLSYFSKKIGKIDKAFYHYMIGNNNGTFNNVPFKHLTDTYECFKNLEEFYLKNNETELKDLVSRKKNLRLIGAMLGNKFSKFQEYDDFLDKYLKMIKKDKFIFKKYKEVLKDESYTKIILFDLVKIFPNKNLIRFLSKIVEKIRE